MIKVKAPAGFEAERRYVFDVLLTEMIGLDYHYSAEQHRTSYVIEFEERAIEIADAFFGTEERIEDLFAPEHIPASVTLATSPNRDDLICLYGSNVIEFREQSVHCGVDLIAGAFFMLTRWEEAVLHDRDMHDRFPAASALIVHTGYSTRPVVDEYVAFLKTWLLEFGVPQDKFRKRSFRVHLQSDVDTALYWTGPFSIFRKLGFRLFRQHAIGAAGAEIRNYLRYLRDGHDPYDTFDYLMDLAEEQQTEMTFFFPVDGKHALDNTQTLRNKHVLNFFAHVILRGHNAGIHYSYLSSHDVLLVQRETAWYERLGQADVLRGRQHFLRCSVPETWQSWEAAGLEHDYTMGYPEKPGFRCGTSHPFRLFDFRQRSILGVYEHPLIAMDVTFHQYLKCSPEAAIESCLLLMETVRKHQGEFVFLWHNSSFGQDWRGWEQVPERIMGLG